MPSIEMETVRQVTAATTWKADAETPAEVETMLRKWLIDLDVFGTDVDEASFARTLREEADPNSLDLDESKIDAFMGLVTDQGDLTTTA